MTESSTAARRPLAAVAVLLAAVWLAVGASYKWLAGSPNDLPALLHGGPIEIGLLYKLAIGIELFVVVVALLRPRIGWVLLALQYLVFIAILVPLALSDEASCGCFGSKVTIAPEVMIGIDGFLLAAILAMRPWSARLWSAPLPAVALVALAGIAAPWVYDRGRPVATPDGDTRAAFFIFEVEQWEGTSAIEIDLAQYLPEPVEFMMPGTWVLYRDSCPHCKDHMWRMIQQDSGTEPITLIKIPEPGLDPAAVVVDALPEGPHVQLIELVPGTEYVVQGPLDMRVEWEDYLISNVRLAEDLADESLPAFPPPDPAVLRAAAQARADAAANE
ncbi:hypothetical protein Pla163_05270 [Planctomycetes bacterium Pla163]|uniref:Methylamine utilisation protein MauE domain-containing protein n=1 Tax=Rohdeia mirabilis TaxID=2528008 RepID=A0A518CW54_9BACT|nr:hypothetical protein Pla163_05270 [Planctomycetes bacterium Pla163]